MIDHHPLYKEPSFTIEEVAMYRATCRKCGTETVIAADTNTVQARLYRMNYRCKTCCTKADPNRP